MSEPLGDMWQSPLHVVERSRGVMGSIDLDPASSPEANQRIKATAFYTRQDNGIVLPWEGNIWLNPPYSKVGGISQAQQFLMKMKYEYEEGRMKQGIILTNVCTGSQWFEGMWELMLCFVRGRLHFTHPTIRKDAPRYDNVLGYLGPPEGQQRFARTFLAYGHIVKPEPF